MLALENKPNWAEKYRPQKLDDLVLPTRLHDEFKRIIDAGKLPGNLILHGQPGGGKTTLMQVLGNELQLDSLLINGSLQGNIDTLRNEIMTFASTVSLLGTRKVVFLDEADYLNANSTQPALRTFMEQFSEHCGFIFTANYVSRIIEPLRSRLVEIEISYRNDEIADCCARFMRRAKQILDQEKIKYNPKYVAKLIQESFPDWRRVLNYLQRYSTSGELSPEVINEKHVDVTDLILYIKKRDFDSIRQWSIANVVDATTYRVLYGQLVTLASGNTIPELVVIIARYQYQSAFVVSQDINFTACCCEIMQLVEWV